MRVPKDVYGRDFANHLMRHWDYRELRQTGSHIILRTEVPSVRTLSIPAHKPLRLGTFRAILEDVAAHRNLPASDILSKL